MNSELTDDSAASDFDGARPRIAPKLAESDGARTSFSTLHATRALLLSMWLGAAVFFSAAVAPSVFAVLPSREMAGAVVSRTLAIVNVAGFVISLLLAATVALARGATRRFALGAEASMLLVVAVGTGVGHWVVAARMQTLRAAMGAPIEQVAPDSPLRVAFNALHSYSVWALTFAMLAALVAFFLMTRRARRA